MPLDTSPSEIALGQLSSLPFGNIIGAPLTAAIEAQALAAQTTVDFIQDVGLQDVNGQVEAITVTFTYLDSVGGQRLLIVPLLTILPIPFITIDTIDIGFKARITASARQSTTVKKEVKASFGYKNSSKFGLKLGKILNVENKTEFSASFSSKKDSTATQSSEYSVEYTMDVAVKASQAGMPQGLATILNILQDGISNKPIQQQKLLILGLATTVDFTVQQTEDFTILVLDDNGDPRTDVTVTVAEDNTAFLGAPTVTVSGATHVVTLPPAGNPTAGLAKLKIEAKLTANPNTLVDTALRAINVVV